MRAFFGLLALLGFSLAGAAADWTEKMTINGYFSHEYEQHIDGDNSKRADHANSFDADMFDVVLNVQATDRLRIAADLTWEHGPQTEIGKGNVATEYAFAEYAVSDAVKIRAGKMFIPFGIYNEIHTAKPAFLIMKEPNPTNKMYFIEKGAEGINYFPRWGSGVAVLGDSEFKGVPFDYIFQVTNGDLDYYVGSVTDLNEYDKDDNQYKAVTFRTRADLTDDLQVGFSLYSDVLTAYGYDDTEEEWVAVGKNRLESQGLQMLWHLTDRLALEGEVVTGTYQQQTDDKIRRVSYSLLASYLMPGDVFTPYFLYAQADPNLDRSGEKVIIHEPGVNIEIDHNMFLKVELFNVHSERYNTYHKGLDYTEFRTALAIGF